MSASKNELENMIQSLTTDNYEGFGKDFVHTWDKSFGDLKAVLEVAAALKEFYKGNISLKSFKSGLAVSIFRDNSTRTRMAFSSAVNLLGLYNQEIDENKSQVAHGETVRETANMISFLTEVIGIRDDKYLGIGCKYIKEIGEALSDGHKEGVLDTRPTIINLQDDLDHPTQSMADLLHMIEYAGGYENLKNKKIAMTWAYSPSYGKPLSVPQGIIGLMSRFGMNISLAYPEGYELHSEIVDKAKAFSIESGGSFEISNDMGKAFEGADFVYPKSWAPYSVMEKRTELLLAGQHKDLDELEKACLENNKKFKNWVCDENLMSKTKDGNALYLHCLPADISGVSCTDGEVTKEVFEKYRIPTYKEAKNKPYIIAAMIMLSKFKDVRGLLNHHLKANKERAKLFANKCCCC
jgi:knotted carbamoyltransferase YgeW